MTVMLWFGTIMAILMAIVYLILVIVTVVGFTGDAVSLIQNIIFAAATGAVGVLIMMSMKFQGKSFACTEPGVKYWRDKWMSRRTKKRRYKSEKGFWIGSTIGDVLFKGLTIGAATVGLAYIFIDSSDDVMKIMFAICNFILFIAWGFRSLSKSYTFYCTEHIEWIKNQLGYPEVTGIPEPGKEIK